MLFLNTIIKKIKTKKKQENFNNFVYSTLINQNLELFQDRREELKEYLNITSEELEKRLNGILDQRKEKELKKASGLPVPENDFSTDEKLIGNYQKGYTNSIISHLLRYTRYENAFDILWFLNSQYKNPEKVKAMDYGCGVADYGLAFAINNYDVTLCDLEGGNIEFGKWRFDRRNIKYSTILINLDNMYPEFGYFDVIIAGDVLEHIRNPLRTARNFYNSLPKGGYLWVSTYPYERLDVGSSHLVEADQARQEVIKYFDKNFEREKRVKRGYLLRKK